jgi:N-acetylneuraminic acid mutarotase
VELYDLDRGVWSKGPSLATARSHAAFAVYGHHLFVLGGKTAQGATAAVESFSLVKGAWTSRTPLPLALHGAVASKLGERLVVSGGVVDGRASAKGWRIPFPFGTR